MYCIGRFFETKHRENYRVYNLCVESNRQYPAAEFKGRGTLSIYLLSSIYLSPIVYLSIYLSIYVCLSHAPYRFVCQLNSFLSPSIPLSISISIIVVGKFPFADHQAPPLEMMSKFCSDVVSIYICIYPHYLSSSSPLF